MSLKLSRKLGQSISIADGLITIGIHRIKGNRVTLEIIAEPDINVYRSELGEWDPSKKEKNGSKPNHANPAGRRTKKNRSDQSNRSGQRRGQQRPGDSNSEANEAA